MLFHVTYQSVCKQCKKNVSLELMKPHTNMVSFLSKAALKCRCFSSGLSVVEGQPVKIQSVEVGNLLQLCRDWLSVLSLMETLRHRKNLQGELGSSNPLGCCHRFTVEEVPVQEDSRSLATDRMTSNHVIYTVALCKECAESREASSGSECFNK